MSIHYNKFADTITFDIDPANYGVAFFVGVVLIALLAKFVANKL